MTETPFSRRQFVGMTAAGAAAASLPGCGVVTGGRGRLVVVTAAPLLSPDRSDDAFRAAVESHRAAAVNLVVVPIAAEPNDSSATLASLLRLERQRDRLGESVMIVSGRDALGQLSGVGPLGILPQISGLGALPSSTPEELLAFVGGLHGLGVRIVRPVHQWKNRLGNGCYERTDLRLTVTGRQAIRALQDAGILIDLSGMGVRSSLEALELATRPVVFASSNAAKVHEHRGNLTDEQIQACGRRGGVIAISAFPALVSGSAAPTLPELLRHVDYVVERAGVEHVALGLDFDDRERKRFATDPLPSPPYQYPAGLTKVAELAGLRSGLESRGYGSSDIGKIMGGNFIRVLEAVWDRPA